MSRRVTDRAPRDRLVEVLVLAAELGAVVRAAHQLEAAENVQREALRLAAVTTRELMVEGKYTTYNEAMRVAAERAARGKP